MLERLERWMVMAEGRLGGSEIRVLVSAGNDDYAEVDGVLDGATKVEDPNGNVVELPGGLQLIGLVYLAGARSVTGSVLSIDGGTSAALP